MYTLHYFFIAVLLTLALQYRAAYERGDKTAATRWLVALAITLGLSFTNHLMTLLLLLPIAALLIGGTNVGDRFAKYPAPLDLSPARVPRTRSCSTSICLSAPPKTHDELGHPRHRR